jgi:hypothetical protein
VLLRRWSAAPFAIVALLGLFAVLNGQPPPPAPGAPQPPAPAPGAPQPPMPMPPMPMPPAGAPTPAPAAGPEATLQWKLEKGKTFFQELTTETKQNMEVMGMKVDQTQKQTFYLSWTVADQTPQGEWVLKEKIEGVKLDISIAGSAINFDSTVANPAANPLSDFFKQLVGQEFTITLGKDMKVGKIDGRTEFLRKLVQANQQMEPLLNRILSEDSLKHMADPTFALLPPNPVVKKGETWEKPSDLNLGPIGSYSTRTKYTYDGQDAQNADLAKLKAETTLTYRPPGANEPAEGLPFKIKTADLKSKDGTGTIAFDVKKGRLDNSSMKLTLEGNLTIEIGGNPTPVNLKQEQTTTLKTGDTSFIKKA